MILVNSTNLNHPPVLASFNRQVNDVLFLDSNIFDHGKNFLQGSMEARNFYQFHPNYRDLKLGYNF